MFNILKVLLLILVPPSLLIAKPHHKPKSSLANKKHPKKTTKDLLMELDYCEFETLIKFANKNCSIFIKCQDVPFKKEELPPTINWIMKKFIPEPVHVVSKYDYFVNELLIKTGRGDEDLILESAELANEKIRNSYPKFFYVAAQKSVLETSKSLFTKIKIELVRNGNLQANPHLRSELDKHINHLYQKIKPNSTPTPFEQRQVLNEALIRHCLRENLSINPKEKESYMKKIDKSRI